VDTAADTRSVAGKVFGPVLTELGASWGDRARAHRAKNMIAILADLQREADERGLTEENLKALPFGDALRVVNAASEEDDPTVQQLWARLLANATDPSNPTAVSKAHIDILKSLSAPEAAFLELLFRAGDPPTRGALNRTRDWESELGLAAEEGWRKFPASERETAIQNLKRLSCITFRPAPLDTSRLLARIPREQYGTTDYAVIDHRKADRFFREVADMLGAAAGLHEYGANAPFLVARDDRPPERFYMLTALGRGLMKACARSRAP